MFNKINVDNNINLNIYKALRLQGDGYNLMYSVWCQNQAHELYDMSWDTFQMTNLHPDAPSENGTMNAYNRGMTALLGRPIQQVIERLDALVLVQKTCKADVCRQPWPQLHPDISNFKEALDQKYDGFFANSFKEAKVGWKQCYSGLKMHNSSTLYSIENEQPVWLNLSVRNLVQRGGASTMECRIRWAMLAALLAVLLSGL